MHALGMMLPLGTIGMLLAHCKLCQWRRAKASRKWCGKDAEVEVRLSFVGLWCCS